jgi:SAM-dependent methyltransferase
MSDSAQNQFTDGAAYERLMGRWSQQIGAQFLDWIAPAKGLRWLDVGCGNGAFTEVVIERALPDSIAGIDPSEAQIAFARTRPRAKSAEFRVGDAQSLPFPDRSFDAAAMALVISFVPDGAKAAREMARVVRPGGPVATYMWDLEGQGFPLRHVYEALAEQGHAVAMPPGRDNGRIEMLRKLWTGAGLDAVETRTIETTVSYADFDDYWASNSIPLGPHGATLKALSAEARDQLKARIDRMLPRDASGRIAFPAVANAVKGRTRA